VHHRHAPRIVRQRRIAASLALVWSVVGPGCGRFGFGAHDTPTDALDAPAVDAGLAVPVQVASASVATTTSLAVTLATPPVSGHLLVMVGGGNIGQLSSISGGSTTWTRAAYSTQHPNIEIWFGVADGTSAVTITASGLTGMNLSVSEWIGPDTSNPLDIAMAAAGTTSPASAGTITTSYAPDLILFGVADYLPNSFEIPTGGPWTQLDSVAMGSSIQTVWYQIATAAGAYEGQVVETMHRWDAAIVAFRIAP
jgi:hypothetical protein